MQIRGQRDIEHWSLRALKQSFEIFLFSSCQRHYVFRNWRWKIYEANGFVWTVKTKFVSWCRCWFLWVVWLCVMMSFFFNKKGKLFLSQPLFPPASILFHLLSRLPETIFSSFIEYGSSSRQGCLAVHFCPTEDTDSVFRLVLIDLRNVLQCRTRICFQSSWKTSLPY